MKCSVWWNTLRQGKSQEHSQRCLQKIRFDRSSLDINQALLDILSDVTDVRDIKEFFDCAENLEIILGDEIFCG